jgi:hypothetical protein
VNDAGRLVDRRFLASIALNIPGVYRRFLDGIAEFFRRFFDGIAYGSHALYPGFLDGIAYISHAFYPGFFDSVAFSIPGVYQNFLDGIAFAIPFPFLRTNQAIISAQRLVPAAATPSRSSIETIPDRRPSDTFLKPDAPLALNPYRLQTKRPVRVPYPTLFATFLAAETDSTDKIRSCNYPTRFCGSRRSFRAIRFFFRS